MSKDLSAAENGGDEFPNGPDCEASYGPGVVCQRILNHDGDHNAEVTWASGNPEPQDIPVYTLSQLSAKVDADFRARRRFYDGNVIGDTEWNGWRLDPDRLVLDLFDPKEHHAYEVDLERCIDSAHILDWVVQVSKKGWLDRHSATVTVGLLQALDDILHLQTNVCPSETHKVLTGEKIRELVLVFQQRFHAGEQP